MYSQEKDDSGNLQLGSRSFSYGLRKELKKKAYFDKFFSTDFWNGKYKHEKKTNFTHELFPQNCEGGKECPLEPGWEQQLLQVKCAVNCVQAAAEPACADLPESPDSGPPAQGSA